MRKSKILLLTINTFLSLAVFVLFYSPSICLGAEKTYLVTESQLTILEQNLNKLKEQNKILQEQLQISTEQVQNLKMQSEQLQTQVQILNQSLTNAQKLLTQYENNHQENKDYAIGVGGGSNGLGLYASKDKTWMYLDKDTATIGWQIKF
ncbi:hypothetical protein [Megamonas sp.]|uniref:hypothetical protein n=1 Tax=Megamonas TaxID=158846 RepID=UPI002588AFFD|nr:hypothetical protein [Megamonas sp.]MBD9297130.1 hypothetical protein [Megamonas funiformis]